MIAGLAYLDVALLAILAISGMVAMYRGLTRELLSIISWAVAAGAVVYFIRYHRAFAEEIAKQFSNPVQTSYIYVAQVAIGGLIFLVVLVVVHLITSRISDTVLDSRVGPGWRHRHRSPAAGRNHQCGTGRHAAKSDHRQPALERPQF